MQLNKSPSKNHFDENAKQYVINMKNNSRKLHRKNGCQHSQYISEYYDFDTLDEAKNSGVNFTSCRNCFDEDITPIETKGGPDFSEVYNKYYQYWNCIKGGLIGLVLGLIFLAMIPVLILNCDFSDPDSYVPCLFAIIPFLFMPVISIINIRTALKIKKEYGKYFTDRIKNAHKGYAKLIKWICIVIGIITSIVLIIVFATTLSDKKSNTHKDYSDGDYYENYDYDDDGEINQNEWEDALGDYMDEIMN